MVSGLSLFLKRGLSRPGLIALGSLLMVTGAGANGQLLWQDQVDTAGRDDSADAIAAAEGRIYVVGTGMSAVPAQELVVRAYEAKNGILLWQDRTAGTASDVSVDGGRVYAAGSRVDATGNLDGLARAYVARTGVLLWEDQFDVGSDDVAVAVVAREGRVYVAGQVTTTIGDRDVLVRTLDARTGKLVWQDQFDLAGDDDGALSIAAGEGRVYAAGFGTLPGGPVVFLVRAYEARLGTLLWQDQFSMGSNDAASAITVAGGQVYAVGRGGPAEHFGNADFLVRAYDAKGGTLLWQDQFDTAGRGDNAVAVAAAGGRVYAAGFGVGGSGGNDADFLVRAYDAKSGTLVWQDQFDMAGSADSATTLAVREGRVYAAGAGTNAAGDRDFLIRAYDPKTGAPIWQDQFDMAGGEDWAVSIAAVGDGVYAAGSGSNGVGHRDLLVRAYTAR